MTCPACNLASWIALDALKQENVCDLCGSQFDATRQLVSAIFCYRRTGILGLERNTQGAVPVALVLQQLYINIGITHHAIYAPSYYLVPNAGIDLRPCEVDFLMILPHTYADKANKAEVILGEGKDEGGTRRQGRRKYAARCRFAARANRFETYIVFAKLAPFTSEEAAISKDTERPLPATGHPADRA